MKHEKVTSHEDWLKKRKSGIGGSDAAAVMGMNSYASPFSVWADKTGRSKPKEETEAMRIGHDLEDYVAKRWCEQTGKKVRRDSRIHRNDDYPFALATIDRWVVGEKAGLECKTTNVLNLQKFNNGEYPDNYYVQCMHYMAVTGADRWYLAVLVMGREFFTYTIERDEDEIRSLMEGEAYFWNEYVLKDNPPPADGMKSTTQVINGMYSIPVDDDVDLFGLDEAIDNYMAVKQQIKELDGAKEKMEQSLKIALGGAERGYSDHYQVTWKAQSRRTFQAKQFAKDHPEMDLEKYYKTSNYRKFEVKEMV